MITTVVSMLLLLQPLLPGPQLEKETWKRVYTSEDSIIELDTSRVVFTEYNAQKKITFAAVRVGRVTFRTVFSKGATLMDSPPIKYKTRVETIEFNCPAKRYRLYEATLLDSKGKVVRFLERDTSENWRELRFGSMMEKLSLPACKLIDEKRRNP